MIEPWWWFPLFCVWLCLLVVMLVTVANYLLDERFDK